MEDQVFLSYRRSDTDAEAAFLRSEINRRFGAGAAFDFMESNEGGEDYAERLALAVSRSRVVVALIGPKWEKDPGGGTDWVIRELRDAVDAGVPILPLLVRRSDVPPVTADQKLDIFLRTLHAPTFQIQSSGTGDCEKLMALLAKRFGVTHAKPGVSIALRRLLGNWAELLFRPRVHFLIGSRDRIPALLSGLFLLFLLIVFNFTVINLSDIEPFDAGFVGTESIKMFGVACTVAVFLFLLMSMLMRGRHHVGPLNRWLLAIGAVTTLIFWQSLPDITVSWLLNTPTGREFQEDATIILSGRSDQSFSFAIERALDSMSVSEKFLLGASILALGIELVAYCVWSFRTASVFRRMGRFGRPRAIALFAGLIAWPFILSNGLALLIKS